MFLFLAPLFSEQLKIGGNNFVFLNICLLLHVCGKEEVGSMRPVGYVVCWKLSRDATLHMSSVHATQGLL